jgi:hypothetical protein
MVANQYKNSPYNEWSLGLFDCCSYKDPESKWCQVFPTFFPQAMCGSCCIDGEIYTIMHQDRVCCLRMSWCGWRTCALQAPFAVFGPFGGVIMGLCCGIFTRREVVERYNIKTNGMAECVPYLCFPCSTFQILMTLRDYQSRGIVPNGQSSTGHKNDKTEDVNTSVI